MSRVGPRLRRVRALGTPLPGLTRKSAEKRPNRPGQHGPTSSRRTMSVYAARLREKQKLRFNYVLTETALRRVVSEAFRLSGNTGDVIVQLLERRLDNVLFRAGFAPTIPAARQMVAHGHVFVNGRVVDVASYRLRRGDIVNIRSKSRPLVARVLEGSAYQPPDWLQIDRLAVSLLVAGEPDPAVRPFDLEPRLVVEHYSGVL